MELYFRIKVAIFFGAVTILCFAIIFCIAVDVVDKIKRRKRRKKK